MFGLLKKYLTATPFSPFVLLIHVLSGSYVNVYSYTGIYLTLRVSYSKLEFEGVDIQKKSDQ